jgi:hypothetical protein
MPLFLDVPSTTSIMLILRRSRIVCGSHKAHFLVAGKPMNWRSMQFARPMSDHCHHCWFACEAVTRIITRGVVAHDCLVYWIYWRSRQVERTENKGW